MLHADTFDKNIISWYISNKRDLPWRDTNNPYFIWLSEIILQQTRVNQGLPFYIKFTENYPNIQDLAHASEEEVLRLWQGLGYYSRGRNLHFTAKYIVDNYNGIFPSTYNEIIKLKGIGKYTAAAIASFAFKEKVAAVDGNVIRVLSRVYNINEPVDQTSTLNHIQYLANELISETSPDLFNQAMMELGATICTPKSPNCQQCPVQQFCEAFDAKSYDKIPFKAKRTKVLDRTINYLVLIHHNKIFLKQRTEKDIWKNMYDFPEIDTPEIPEELSGFSLRNIQIYPSIQHILSHRKLSIQFISAEVGSDKIAFKGNWFTLKDAEKLPKPKVIVDFLEGYVKKNHLD